MIFNAAYEGPPYSHAPALGCGDCQRNPTSLGNVSPIAGLSYTTVGTIVFLALIAAAGGFALWRIKKPGAMGLRGRRRR